VSIFFSRKEGTDWLEHFSPGGERTNVDSDAVKGEIDHQNGRAAYYHEEKTEARGQMIFERKRKVGGQSKEARETRVWGDATRGKTGKRKGKK
jgi:hypothetical protein